MSTVPRGQRLIPVIIDEYAKTQPDRVYAAIPVDDDDLSKGYKEFTFLHLARAVDAASFWLDETLGKSHGDFETFIYLGARDLRYAILIAAAVKTGRAALFPSLFGSMESHQFLAERTKARHILSSDSLQPLAREIHAVFPSAPCIRVPEQSEWLNEHDKAASHYPYTKTFAEAKDDPVVIVHTSGTTGLPKPVFYTHSHLNIVDYYYTIKPVDGRNINLTLIKSDRFYGSLPPFHLAGILSSLLFPVFTEVVTVMGPSNRAPTPEVASQVLQQSGATSGMFPPSLLELLDRNSETMAQLKALNSLIFSGAPLATKVGEELSHVPGLALINFIASTEAAGWLCLQPDTEDWQWFMFHPDMGFEYQQQDDSEMYEVVVHRTPESEKCCNFWRTFPNETVFHTKDLFSPHPTKPGLWRYRCRLDDLILLTGEVKLYCSTIEEAVGNHPFVKGVLVGGDQRSHPFMLLELVDDKAEDPEHGLDEVWSAVEKENQKNAPSARIRRNMTIVVRKDKQLLRLPKGSIERRKTFIAFEAEINDLYGGPIGKEAPMRRNDSASAVVPGTEDLDRHI